jgi:hypothetical protein
MEYPKLEAHKNCCLTLFKLQLLVLILLQNFKLENTFQSLLNKDRNFVSSKTSKEFSENFELIFQNLHRYDFLNPFHVGIL